MVHFPIYYRPYKAYDERGEVCSGAFLKNPFVRMPQLLRLNHYATKSEEEWVARQKKGKADRHGSGTPRWEISYLLGKNDCVDKTAANIYLEKVLKNRVTKGKKRRSAEKTCGTLS